MTLVKSIPLLCFIGVSFLLLVWYDCLQIQPASFHQGTEYKQIPVSVMKLLPRKLQVLTGKLAATVLESAEIIPPSKSYSPEKKILPDELERKKASIAAAKAHEHLGRGQTWQQRMDENGGDSSEFFTMDYSRVRRRRPIHNKGLPVGP